MATFRICLAIAFLLATGCDRSSPTEPSQVLAGKYAATYGIACTSADAVVTLAPDGHHLVASLPSFGTITLFPDLLLSALSGRTGLPAVGDLLIQPSRCGVSSTPLYFDYAYSAPAQAAGSFQVSAIVGRGNCPECGYGTQAVFVTLRPLH